MSWSLMMFHGATPIVELWFENETNARKAYVATTEGMLRRKLVEENACVALIDDYGRCATINLFHCTAAALIDREVDRRERIKIEAELQTLKGKYPAPGEHVGFIGGTK